MAAGDVSRQVSATEDEIRGLDRAGQGRGDDEIDVKILERDAGLSGLLLAKFAQSRIDKAGITARQLIGCVEGGLAVANERDVFQENDPPSNSIF